jgi:hypothetical protein
MGKASTMRYRWRSTRRALVLAVTATTLLAGPFTTQAQAERDHVGWQSFLEQPRSSDVRSVSATVLSGDVDNARGVTSTGRGVTTLTVPPGGRPATILLDYGVEVEGSPTADVESFTGAGGSPSLSLAFTEARTYLRTPGSSTLAVASAAGASTITVQPGSPRRPLTFAPDDTVTVGSPGEVDRIESVSGATLTLRTPLAQDHAAGATVTSAPGAVTGDSAFMPRSVSLAVTAPGPVSGAFMGGFRFEAITLSTPGTVVLRRAGLHYGGFLAKASDYQGWFLSSSADLNRMFYDGAYTEQTNMQPVGVNGGTQLSVLDGTKRDRAIWVGDIKIQGQGIADTIGSNGNDYVKQSLLTLITSSKVGGGLNADTLFRVGPYSNSYSSWTVDVSTDYYRNTGDAAFIQQALPWLEGQLTYDSTLTDSNGLIVTGPAISTTNGGFDWDFYDGAKTGLVTAFNELYYKNLRDLAYVEASLGSAAKAAAYSQTADRVREAINTVLFNPASGTYYLSESDHTTFAQDANAMSVLFGVAPAERAPGIVRALKSLWGPHGSAPFSGSTFSSLISPYITAFEVEAAYLAGDAADAERLLHLTWDQMMDRRGPFFTGTFWENIGADGTATLPRTSLAHGWASGPTPIMTGFVLGVQPGEPGYRTFSVAPHPGSVRWAQGVVPTPFGRIFVSWSRDDDRFSLTVQAPAGTSASIALPDGRRAVLNGGAHGAERTFTVRDRDDRTDTSGGD